MKKGLGYKIRKIRELKNISQDYVAKHIGVSQSTYSCIESDRVKIDEKKLIRIATALIVETDAIRNFNEASIFNLGLSAQKSSLPAGREPLRTSDTYNSNFSPLEKLQEIYEKLLMEKNSRIKLLEEIVNKKIR